MNYPYYENHQYKNTELPLIFHNITTCEKRLFHLHWHENIELLFVTDGKLKVCLNGEELYACRGETVVVNSGFLHDMAAVTDSASYFVLIADADFCANHGFHTEEKLLQSKINDSRLFDLIYNIKNALDKQPPYYEEDILSDVIKILIRLFRHHTLSDISFDKANKKIEMVKQGLRYIKHHFNESLSTDSISSYTGYSKYYFCHCFKEFTGFSLSTYINKYRTDYAYTLLKQTDMNVTDIAFKCGFDDVSYFSKVFKKHTGILPTSVRKK